ncbi:MAG: DUF1523 family protein [Lachnospiraceae bacterium]|nr:DUF1523 family protein [Lachnospiraceae bacterium]
MNYLRWETEKSNKFSAFVVVVVLIIIASIGFEIACNTHESTYTITVTDKERVTEGSSSRYLVFSTDDNSNILVFENTDTFWRGKWNSSNVQGELQVGQKYQITTIGFRVPIFSMYENIISVSLVE